MFGRNKMASGDRRPGESAISWLERRAPNDPIGRLTIIKVGNGRQGTVLTQMQALAGENPATLQAALAEIAQRWPAEAAIAWSAAFPGQHHQW